MSRTLFLRRGLSGLQPIDAPGEAVVNALKRGDVVRAEIFRPRNLRHHRKMYALIQAVFPHQDVYPTQELFVAAIKAAVGLCDTFNLPSGKTVVLPRSWSFANMDQSDFDEIYKRVEQVILTKILPGVNEAELEAHVHDIMAGYGR
jgi:Protein of unknown function (DUF1367)